jgi:predicted cupin superfamily sugar epimerase
MTEADQIIAKLGLQPHPEGGWYRQTWVGPDLHIGTDTRASGTAILFLLKAGERSHWHRVDADEIWIWNAGAPLMLSLGETVARDIRMGPDVLGDDQALKITLTPDTEARTLTIEDNGTGISPEHMGAIFEPYRTTKASGSGLGLLIVRRIIREHGGEIEIESEEGHGTRIVVFLPRGERTVRLLGEPEDAVIDIS